MASAIAVMFLEPLDYDADVPTLLPEGQP